MKKLVIVGVVFALFTAVGAWINRDILFPAPQPQQQVEVPKAPETKDVTPAEPRWPGNARFSVVSANGETVALIDGRDIVVMRQGKEAFRIEKIRMLHPDMRLSPNGKRLAVQWMAKEQVVLWDVTTREVVSTTPYRGQEFEFNEFSSWLLVGKDKRRVPTGTSGLVPTDAVVSDDGRTTALYLQKVQIYREGKPLSEINTFVGNPILNRDGWRLLGYDTKKEAVILVDTVTAKVLKEYKASPQATYVFSPGGWYFGVLEANTKELVLRHSGSGTEAATLSASYTFRIDNQFETINYKLNGQFHFYAVEPTDSQLTVVMGTLPPEGSKTPGSVQWGLVDGRFRNTNRVLACLDQHLDFDGEGNLIK